MRCEACDKDLSADDAEFRLTGDDVPLCPECWADFIAEFKNE